MPIERTSFDLLLLLISFSLNPPPLSNVILEPWGNLDLDPPPSSYYPPVLDKGWCGFQVSPEDRTHSRPFKIPEGLAGSELRFVLNVTYSIPTYVSGV